MGLDKQISEMIASAAENNVPPIYTLAVSEARDLYRMMTIGRLSPEEVVEVGEVVELMVPCAKSRRPARLYTPIKKTESNTDWTPLIIFFHGGGWVIGDLDTHDNMARNLCKWADSAVISIDYRLAPENPYPAGVQDSLMSSRWIIQNKEKLLPGCNSIGIAGDSAGGNLAAIAATEIAKDLPDAIDGVFLIYPSLDAGGAYESQKTNGEGYVLENKTIDWFLDKYLDKYSDLTDPFVSPLQLELPSQMPPVIIYTAEFDPLRDEGKAYFQKLQKSNIKVTYKECKGMVHGFYDLGVISETAKKYIIEGCELFGKTLTQR